MSGSPYLEHIAQLEQEIEESRDALEIMAEKLAGYQKQRDEMKSSLTKALEEIAKMDKWKREAIEVLNQWDEVWIASGSPGKLGQSKSKSTLESVMHRGDSRTPWDYCPECGSKKHEHFLGYEKTHRYCLECNQEWHTDIDYSGFTSGNLAKLKCENAAIRKLIKGLEEENHQSSD